MIHYKLLDRLNKINSELGLKLVLDMGSSRTRILVTDRGVVVDEASLLARPRRKRWIGLSAPEIVNQKAIAFGDRAKTMKNRESVRIEVVAPVERGIINDLEAGEELLSYFFSIVSEIPTKFPKLFKFWAIVSVPNNVTDVEKRALRSVLYSSGARKVTLIESSLLASIGLGLDINKNSGLMIVDVGGGKTEISVVSLGGVVVSKNIKLGGIDCDRDLVNYIKMRYGVLIGELSAENIKVSLGQETDDKPLMVVRGRDLESGLPKTIKIGINDVIEALSLTKTKIVKAVTEVIDEMPPEIVDDVFNRGIWLIGGGAKIEGLAKLIEAETKILTRVADEGDRIVVNGGGKIFADNNLLNHMVRLASI